MLTDVSYIVAPNTTIVALNTVYSGFVGIDTKLILYLSNYQ